MAETQLPAAMTALDNRPVLNLIPVGLREASLDSPTFRATSLHFADQIDAVERWLDGYVKAASRLVVEVSSLEAAVNSFLGQSMPPASISEAVLDHDYTLLAMRRYGEGARDFWGSTLRGIKRYDGAVIDPIKGFLTQDLRNFKDARRAMEAAQKNFDGVISRYSAQSKGKEASSLREEAFQLHEARKVYLKASMDFCVQAPQLRASLDKLLVRIYADQWKDMRQSRESTAATLAKWGSEMERVRGWSREMENSERAFKRELLTARKLIEEAAEQKKRPSRELEDYAASTVPYLGTGASSTTGANNNSDEVAEKQGWLFMRTMTGRPARTLWSRRWFFVKSSIFGWLVQGTRSGGVEESDRTGVLLCSVRPAFQEERRFCFEVKTKDQSIILQAETQQELTEWISAFEMAKRKALEHPANAETSSSSAPGIDPAFAISPPAAPEFAAKSGDGHTAQTSEDLTLGHLALEREGTGLGLANRASFDVNPRRVMSLEREPDGGLREASRDHAARIIQKLDLHKRSTASPATSQGPASGGGIASLISASHNILPVGPGTADGPKRTFTMPVNSLPTSSLAPSTLANPPSATNLSHTAVIVSGERGIGLGRADGSGVPSGILANLWGSSNWGHVSRLGDEALLRRPISRPPSAGPSRAVSISQDDSIIMDGQHDAPNPLDTLDSSTHLGHRKNLSIGGELHTSASKGSKDDIALPVVADDYPSYYPLPLKAQNAQFRMLFPAAPKSEKVVLVFRATLNPNEQQEFPGRIYVTAYELYFFSNHLGLVLVTGISLLALSEVTAAPGRDCDYIYLHLKEGYRPDDARRFTIKIFLEPLKLLQRRLSFLLRNAHSDEPAGLEEIIKTLIRMETEPLRRRSSAESWEWEDIADEAGGALDVDPITSRRRDRNIKASLRVDGTMYGEIARTGREIQKFKLPTQPVVYAPQSMTASISRDFNVSAKALFHIMFGDKSAVFQLLYANRWATTIVQTPWTKMERGHWSRKFTNTDHMLIDTQTIDIFNDHLCYVVTNDKQPHQMPYADSFVLTIKFVVTHTAKSRSKLATFQSLTWRKPPPMPYLKRLIERQAYNALQADALDLSNVAMDQVAKLGNHSKTNKAVEIFGSVGQQKQTAQIDSSKLPSGALAVMSPIPTRPVSIAQLVRNDVFARTLSAFSVVFDLATAIGKGVISLCTGHTLLVIVLAISALYNSWHGYRDGLAWYNERGTIRFMTRVGVSPDTMMSKGVYLHDIEDLVAPWIGDNATMPAFTSDHSLAKTCRSTFHEHLTWSTSLTRPDVTDAQFQRTRASLAKQRHDLLVGLRVVNRIEKDIVLAEYEQWVRAEERNCRRVEMLLRRLGQNQEATPSASSKSLSAADLDAELGEDFAEYCNSCRLEISELENGTRLI